MRIDILGYGKRVLDDFTKSNASGLTENPAGRSLIDSALEDVASLCEDRTIKDFDVYIKDSGSFINVEIDIGAFYEECVDSLFLRLLERCIQFEVHPGVLTRVVFIFDGIWEDKYN